jgi:hypothetical protein
MLLSKNEKKSPCLRCKHSLKVNLENLAKMPNDIREIHNHLKFAGHKDEEFTLCPLDGYQAIVSKYVDWDCYWCVISD